MYAEPHGAGSTPMCCFTAQCGHNIIRQVYAVPHGVGSTPINCFIAQCCHNKIRQVYAGPSGLGRTAVTVRSAACCWQQCFPPRVPTPHFSRFFLFQLEQKDFVKNLIVNNLVGILFMTSQITSLIPAAFCSRRNRKKLANS